MEEKINLEGLWAKYSSLFKRAFGETESVDNFLEKFGERIVMCPASHKSDQKYCEPGGLMKQSIDVAITMKKISETLGLNVESTSILRVALAHDLGKIGSEDTDYFIPQDSDWHREKLGALYKFNDQMPRMPVTHVSLHLLASSGIPLTLDETRAISTALGSSREENKLKHIQITSKLIKLQKLIFEGVSSFRTSSNHRRALTKRFLVLT